MNNIDAPNYESSNNNYLVENGYLEYKCEYYSGCSSHYRGVCKVVNKVLVMNKLMKMKMMKMNLQIIPLKKKIKI